MVDDVPDADENDVGVNSLVWITSLHPAERGVTNRILEDLEPYVTGLGLELLKFELESENHLYDILENLRQRAEDTRFKPIIHLDMHGHPQNGLHIVATRENAPWSNVLDHFREINVATNNNLFVFSLACFGLYILAELEIDRPTPFYALIASDREIAAGDIEERSVRFYRRVFETADLGSACREIWVDRPRLWMAERHLFEVLVNFVLTMGRGRQLRQRRESVLTRARQLGLQDNELKGFRRKVKAHLKPNPSLIHNYGKRFYFAQPVLFTMKDVFEAAKLFERTFKRTRNKPPYFFLRHH